uniref:hypothetical protein n=1 Tax=Ferroglobus sp. TaxID=2614230 RepID=UPI0025C38CC7
PYNFTLYVDAETDGKFIWVSYTSTVEGNEEVYIMGSPDGFNWSKPIRLSRNIEYIKSLENPFNFKCDQKDLFIDKDGRAIVVYHSAIYSPKTTMWVVYGKPELGKMEKRIKYNITLPYASKKNSAEIERIPIVGTITTLLSAIIAAYKKKSEDKTFKSKK